jgi:arylsulfatase A-like enzyme
MVSALSSAVVALLAQAAPAPAAARPNIVVVIADDWGFPHAGAYGDKIVKTPSFDRVAREGVLLTNAFAAAPSCTPSRAAILTGRYPHQLEEGGNLWGYLPSRYPVYPDRLEAAGYAVGLAGKGWGPGRFEAGGRARNPAGPSFKSFAEFLKSVPAGKPFAFWHGSHNPHRSYDEGSGERAGKSRKGVRVPPYWVDTQEVRGDVLDYYQEVEAFDAELGEILKQLEAGGHARDTLLVVTSDNGMPFPRAKANVYDPGVHVPLAVRWPARLPRGRRVSAFVNLLELGPTFLAAAGVEIPAEMTGRSLLPLLRGQSEPGRDQVFLERERHANVRKGDLAYPIRAVRTSRYLYVRNLRPDRWPAGDPEMWKAVGPYGDCDNGPTKQMLLGHKDLDGQGRPFELAFARRPAEELYDLAKDPHQIDNLADKPRVAAVKKQLAGLVDRWMKETGDPRLDPQDDRWDKFPYFGDPKPMPRSAAEKK